VPQTSRAEGERQQHRVDRRLEVGLAFLGLAANIGGGGKLALGQAVHTVVLDDVEHVQVAADRVAELPESDRQRIAVARDPDVVEVAIGGIRAHRDRGHAAVNRIEAVRATDEVSRSLRGAADAGQFDEVLWFDRKAPARLHDGRRDGIVAAARAQRRQGALVVAPRHAERVTRQRWMGNFGFGDERHGNSYMADAERLLVPRCRCASTPSTIKLEEIGKPS
jgi:hypothetical protein